MANKKTIYVVSFKRYGDDSYCGCRFYPIKAFKSLEEAKKYAEENDDCDWDEIEMDEKDGK